MVSLKPFPCAVAVRNGQQLTRKRRRDNLDWVMRLVFSHGLLNLQVLHLVGENAPGDTEDAGCLTPLPSTFFQCGENHGPFELSNRRQ